MNLEEAKQEFSRYTEPYIPLGKMCVLKIHHTFRVVDLCKKIAKSLSLSKEDVTLSQMCGLLHDIGRFEQWKRYQTFNDSKGEDHAELGIQVLKNHDTIRKYLPKNIYDDLVIKSIHYHNKYRIEEELTDRERIFCNLIRDADKIDILYLLTIEDISFDIEDGSFTEKTYQNLIHKKEISKKDLKTKLDGLSIYLGYIFDMNYPESFKILKEKNYINKIIDLYEKKTKSRKFITQLEEIRKVSEEYIKEKCTC